MTSTAALATLLTDSDRNVRLRAAMELGISPDSAAAPVLVAALGPELDSRVRAMITWAAVQHADEAMADLVALVQDGNPAVRHQALHVLSKIGGREILPYVLPAVADEDPQVAIKAYRAAASTDAPEVVPALVARLGDGDDEQRDQLNRALRLLGAWPVGPLAEALGSADVAGRLHAAAVMSAAERLSEVLRRAAAAEGSTAGRSRPPVLRRRSAGHRPPRTSPAGSVAPARARSPAGRAGRRAR